MLSLYSFINTYCERSTSADQKDKKVAILAIQAQCVHAHTKQGSNGNKKDRMQNFVHSIQIMFYGETIIQISWGYSTFVYNSHSIDFQDVADATSSFQNKAKQKNKQQ